MEKIRLGKTNLQITRLGFGGIPIQRNSEEEAIAIVKRCLDLGINFIDTANAYTTSEGRIGKAIAGRRDGLVIATKTQARTRQGVEEHIALSLKNLQIDSIDLYQFHNVSDAGTLETVLDPAGPMGAALAAKKAGLIKHIGITSHQMDTAIAAVKTGQFETMMFPFNFVTPEALDELLPLCERQDIGFICMKPLAGGVLENATLAFKYLMQFPNMALIPGIEKSPEIDEIVAIMNSPTTLTDEERTEMERIRQMLGPRFCRRCDYCLPCPADIPISVIMHSASFEKRFAPETVFAGWISFALAKAADCTQCGECETRCPFNLPIREMVAQSAHWFEEQRKKFLAAKG